MERAIRSRGRKKDGTGTNKNISTVQALLTRAAQPGTSRSWCPVLGDKLLEIAERPGFQVPTEPKHVTWSFSSSAMLIVFFLELV